MPVKLGLKIETTGSFSANDFIKRAEQVLAEANREAVGAVRKSIEEGQLQGPHSGKEYPSADQRGVQRAAGRGFVAQHRASKPGEEPAADRGLRGGMLGALREDFSQNRGPAPMASIGWEGAFADQARVLEFGNARGTLQRRPFADKAGRRGTNAGRIWLKVTGMAHVLSSSGSMQVTATKAEIDEVGFQEVDYGFQVDF